MKMMRIYTAATAATALLGLASASSASGAPSAQDERVYRGTVTAVDASDHMITVRNFLFTRNFNLGNDCKVTLQDKPKGDLADLHPGQQVDIRYDGDHGVYIAKYIAQHDLSFAGHLTGIDPQHRTLLIRHGAMTREFALAPNYAVVMRDNNEASLNNLQLGDEVNVIYERVNGSHMVRRIEQNSASITSTIVAVDTSTRTIRTRDGKGEKQFTLEDNCPIVINNNLHNGMDSLMVGEQATINYNNVDGVLVANRVSPVPGPVPTAPALTKTAQQPSMGQWHAYNSYNY